MAHQSRLDHALRLLLANHRVAALGTVGSDNAPMVSMVPFAVEPQSAALVIHVSALAAHTGNMALNRDVSILVMQPEVAGEPVHALPRVTLRGRTEVPARESEAWLAARDAYLARFPDAQPMLQLGDFQLVLIRIDQARHIAGFGAARTVEGRDLALALTLARDGG
jgi:putative heme iron utilization protein